MTMHLRPYLDVDYDGLVTAWRAASVVAHPFLTPDFLESEVESIREVYLPAAESWVAVEHDEVLGFMALMGNEVGAFFVHPKAWGRGIGKLLMDKAAEVRGDLTLDVFEANEIGRAFYKRYGFVVTSQDLHEETGQARLHMKFTAPTSTAPSDSGSKPNHEGA